jgi:hypothetical protein
MQPLQGSAITKPINRPWGCRAGQCGPLPLFEAWSGMWATNGLCPRSRSFCSKPTVLLKSAECKLCSLQFAGCRLPRKPPPTLCGLRSAVCGLGAASYPPFVVVLGLASLCAYLLARPDKGRCCIVSVSSAHCSSSNLHSSLLLTTLSLETLERHSTHSRLALLLHACPPAGLVTASPPPWSSRFVLPPSRESSACIPLRLPFQIRSACLQLLTCCADILIEGLAGNSPSLALRTGLG